MKKISLLFSILIIYGLFSGCQDSKHEITKLEDLHKSVIGVMTGTTGEQHAKKRFPEANIKSFDDVMDAIASLKSNQVDVVVTAYSTAFNIKKHNPDLDILKDVIEYEKTCIALRKGNPELLQKLNEFIAELHQNGILKDMSKRWFKLSLEPYEEIKITLPTEGEVLKIGVSATREPICFMDKNQQVSGHDGELARRISAKLGRPIEFVNMKFSALITALQSGKIDIIVTGMTATDERRKAVDFTSTYFDNAQVALYKKTVLTSTDEEKNTLKLKSLEDLKDKRIGVLLGSVHDKYAMKNFPNAKIMQFKSPPDMLLAVKSAKVDAAFYTRETIVGIVRDDKELGFVDKDVFEVKIGIGFNKENDPLKEKFNSFLKEITSTGIFNDMKTRWVDNGINEMPEISNPNPSGELLVGTVSDKGLPFTIVKDNKMIGFDIELSERFAAHIGKKLKLIDMEFGSLIAAVSTNKIDMIASTLMITEERQKQIDFSEPYMALGASVFALSKNIAGSESNVGIEEDNSIFNSISNSFYNNIILENRYLLILDGLQTTFLISILASIFGTALGALVCWMRMSRKKIINITAKIYISILRGTPVLVVLMLIFYVVFASVDINPVFVAVIAFGLNFAAYVSEMFRAGIENVSKGQSEAGIALGFSKIKTFIYIILPQAVRQILPIYKGEFITLVKMTSIVGYIAVQDLTKASDIIRSRTFDAFFPLIFVAVLYFLISWLLLLALGYVERKTDPKMKLRGGK